MSLGKLTVNGRQDGFLCEGKPFFWFADTCWSAFTSITEADWDYYLTRRAEQGMNVLQINTLPQWDRCCPDLGIWPYASEDGELSLTTGGQALRRIYGERDLLTALCLDAHFLDGLVQHMRGKDDSLPPRRIRSPRPAPPPPLARTASERRRAAVGGPDPGRGAGARRVPALGQG